VEADFTLPDQIAAWEGLYDDLLAVSRPRPR
jgi:hypothetical protein